MENKELTKNSPQTVAVSPEVAQALALMVQQIIAPTMGTIGKLLEENMKALKDLSQTQKLQSERMEAIEKQLRLNTLVTATQERYLKGEIKKRAEELLAKKGLEDDRKAATALGGSIRKAVLSRYGAGQLREIPRHEYSVAMSQIGSWNDQVELLKITKAARKRAEATTAPPAWDPDEETRKSGLLEG